MPQTQTDDSGVLPFPRELPPLPRNGTELYDSIMRMVEPELISSEIPKVRERLTKEGPEQAKEHAKRYMEAFRKFNQIMKQSEKTMHQEIKDFTRTAYASLEQISLSFDHDRMEEIEEGLKKSKEVEQKTTEELMKEEAPEPNIS